MLESDIYEIRGDELMEESLNRLRKPEIQVINILSFVVLSIRNMMKIKVLNYYKFQ